MAWETVDDGMGCTHCFTKRLIGKKTSNGKHDYLVRKPTFSSHVIGCVSGQKGVFHDIDMWLVCRCVCVVVVGWLVAVFVSMIDWNDKLPFCTMHRERSTQLLV